MLINLCVGYLVIGFIFTLISFKAFHKELGKIKRNDSLLDIFMELFGLIYLWPIWLFMYLKGFSVVLINRKKDNKEV